MSSATDRLSAALAGRYRIERHLGEGGMATVYLAEDLKHRRKVAVKVLRPELAAVLGAARFVQEITTTANLQHPHILPLFDSGDADGFLYYVMPFIDGETLRDKLNRETQLGIDEAVGITVAIADALDYAHRQNVIHRDIKPENILLHDGRPMVADFGIALAVSAAAGGRMTETGLSLGTPHYMSPEQATADKDLTNRSDIYSLASVLYEMLTGEPPHTAGSAQAVVMKIVTDVARPVAELRKSVPPHVAAATGKALEKVAADRFESAKAFAEALVNPAFTLPTTQATIAGAASATGPWNRVSVGLAVVATVLFGTTMWGWLGPGPEVTPTGPTVLTLDPGVDELSPLARINVSRDGRTFVIEWRDGDESPLYVRSADEPDFRPLPGTESAWFASFSPEGEWIAYRDQSEDMLMKVAVSGGRPITLFTDERISPWYPHWGDDGRIVFTGPNGTFVVSGSGGVPERVLESGVAWPHLLPDGSGVLIDRQNIELLDFATGSTSVLIEQGRNAQYLASGHILFAHPSGGLFVIPFDLGSHTVAGERTPVMDDVSETYYAVSASGTLVFRSGMQSGPSGSLEELVRVSLDGGLDTLRLAPRNLSDTRISPDGRRLVYQDLSGDDDQLYLYDFELGGPRQLTFEGDNDMPQWSPDGSRIVFASTREGSDGYDLHVMPVDGSGRAELLLTRPGDQFPENWTEDGIVTIYETNGAPPDLWALPAEGGGEPQPFLVTEWAESRLSVSPDGQWGAYQSNQTGANEVYVRAFPSGEGQRRVSTGGGTFPRWSPDGETIFFVRDAQVDTIFAARVQLEPSFLVTETDVIYTAPEIGRFDVHPDGTHLIVEVTQPQVASAGDEEPVRSRIVVVLNWFEELRERLGRD